MENASPDTAILPRQQSGALALLAGGRAETAKALMVAVAECHAVAKDAKNSFHGYSYASAEAVIEEGRKALAKAGLALLPMEASLNGSEREGADRFELHRTFVLLHTSGEITPLRVCWPVCPEKGRPLDKATAIATTLSLSYLLRDLLLMPRVEPSDDVNARDDRQQQPQQQPRRAKGLPTDGAELEQRLRSHEARLVQAGRCKAGELLAFVQANHLRAYPGNKEAPPFVRWTGDAIRLAVDAVKTFAEQHPTPTAKAAPQPAANGHAAPPAKLSMKQLVELNALMMRKKVEWTFVANAFDLDPKSDRKDFPASRFEELMRALSEEPDPQPARS